MTSFVPVGDCYWNFPSCWQVRGGLGAGVDGQGLKSISQSELSILHETLWPCMGPYVARSW